MSEVFHGNRVWNGVEMLAAPRWKKSRPLYLGDWKRSRISPPSSLLSSACQLGEVDVFWNFRFESDLETCHTSFDVGEWHVDSLLEPSDERSSRTHGLFVAPMR